MKLQIWFNNELVEEIDLSVRSIQFPSIGAIAAWEDRPFYLEEKLESEKENSEGYFTTGSYWVPSMDHLYKKDELTQTHTLSGRTRKIVAIRNEIH